MKNYFLVGIKYEKTAEEGKIIKVSEQYLGGVFNYKAEQLCAVVILIIKKVK